MPERNKFYSLDPEFTNQKSFLINLNIQHKFTSGLKRLSSTTFLKMQNRLDLDRLTKGLNNCGTNALIGECLDNHDHNFLITQRCRKESCQICGKDDSAAHISRKRKAATGLIGFKNLAYFVFTLPQDIREKFLDPEVMKKFQRKVKSIFKSLGLVSQKKISYYDKFRKKTLTKTISTGTFKGGLMRWHFLGEDHKKATGLNVFHPHLNIILGTDGSAWLDPEVLQTIKDDISDYLRNIGSEVKTSVTSLSWRKTIKQKWHLLRYVTRATLTSNVLDNECIRILHLNNTESKMAKKLLITKGNNAAYNPLMFWMLASDLVGFRNNTFFGSVKKNDFDIIDFIDQDENVTEIEKNTMFQKYKKEKKKCPICGNELEWELDIKKVIKAVDSEESYYYDVRIDKKILKYNELDHSMEKRQELLKTVQNFY